MKTYKINPWVLLSRILIAFVFVLFFLTFTHYAKASLVPSLNVLNLSGSTVATVTVYGADPNAQVSLSYPSSVSIASINIGTTNASGYLTTTVDATSHNITPGSTVYVTVDGQASPSTIWPSYSGAIALPLSQTNITVSSGQSTTVTASVSAVLSMTTNTNPYVAGASILGSQITITGFNSGTTNITICAGSVGCNTINVTVPSPGANTTSLSFNPSTISLTVGQSQTVGISGSGPYYVSNNTNPAIASATLNGSVLIVAGVTSGTDTIVVCSSNGGSTKCSSVTVNVTQGNVLSGNATSSSLTFSQNNITMYTGQNQTVSVYGGSGVYYVSNNSAPSSVTVNTDGSNVVITGVSFGGANITICTIDNQCGSLYVYVQPNNQSNNSSTGTLTAPALVSFSVSSSDSNGKFIGSGNTLTVTFITNQIINIPTATVAGTPVSVTGGGIGPYTLSYTMTGQESLPVPVNLHFSNVAGTAGQSSFWIGNTPVVNPIASGSLSGSTANTSSNNNSSSTFTEYLYDGSSGSQVTALQKRLTADGFYSGPITGTFGPLTRTALKAYQAKHGLAQIGVVGPATRVILNRGI